jgi:hypothetical protein
MATSRYDDESCPSEWAEYNVAPELIAQPAVLTPFARHAIVALARNNKSDARKSAPDRKLQGVPLDALDAPGWPPMLLRS